MMIQANLRKKTGDFLCELPTAIARKTSKTNFEIKNWAFGFVGKLIRTISF